VRGAAVFEEVEIELDGLQAHTFFFG
jgi:hypothetical protein